MPSSVDAHSNFGTDKTHGRKHAPSSYHRVPAHAGQRWKGAAGRGVRAQLSGQVLFSPCYFSFPLRSGPDNSNLARQAATERRCSQHPAVMSLNRVINERGLRPSLPEWKQGYGNSVTCTHPGARFESCRVAGPPHPPLIFPHARPAHTPMQVGGRSIFECAVHDSGERLTCRNKEPAQFRLA